jgi:Tol biopolymer transport system component
MRTLLSIFILTAAIAPASAEQLRLGGARRIASGQYVAPRFAPDGRSLLVSGERLRGHSLLALDGAVPRMLTDEEGAGLFARFLPDGRVAWRAWRAGVRRELVSDGSVVREAALGRALVAEQRDDRIWVRRLDGTLVSPGAGDRFFAPVVSPDGARVVFSGLATGLWIFDRKSGALTRAGAGTQPSWSPDGRRLIFERTEDDGHDILASDLWLFDAETHALARLTSTEGVVERRPAFSPDGLSVAFDDDRGTIWTARLEVTR